MDGDGTGFGHRKGHQLPYVHECMLDLVWGELEGVLVAAWQGRWWSSAKWWLRVVQGMLERLKRMKEGLRLAMRRLRVGGYRLVWGGSSCGESRRGSR